MNEGQWPGTRPRTIEDQCVWTPRLCSGPGRDGERFPMTESLKMGVVSVNLGGMWTKVKLRAPAETADSKCWAGPAVKRSFLWPRETGETSSKGREELILALQSVNKSNSGPSAMLNKNQRVSKCLPVKVCFCHLKTFRFSWEALVLQCSACYEKTNGGQYINIWPAVKRRLDQE